MTKRIFISGISGLIGSCIARNLVKGAEGYELVGGWALEAGEDIGTVIGLQRPLGINVADDLLFGLEDANPHIVIDFSSNTVIRKTIRTCANAGVDMIIGTTGLLEDEITGIAELVQEHGLRWIHMPNFNATILFMLDIFEQFRPYYTNACVVDRHFLNMEQAPSGTSMLTAKTLASARQLDTESMELYPGALGADISGIPVTSQRLNVPHHYSENEVILSNGYEILRMTHQVMSPEAYMEGIMIALRKLSAMPPGTLITSPHDLLRK